MIIWEQAPNGNLECVANGCYGVVGLAHPRTGWSARLDDAYGRHTAPVLFHTAAEAKLWVENRIATSCAAKRALPQASRTGHAPAAFAELSVWLLGLAQTLVAALATFQRHNGL